MNRERVVNEMENGGVEGEGGEVCGDGIKVLKGRMGKRGFLQNGGVSIQDER